ncbi:DHH family phosphoesterase [Bacillus paranthracis]|uniref:DHH family phosphoesterase n=1 Tax=Bacillus paranthracis TaxID=2026186 RepID=UPI002FDBDC5F
MLAKLPFHLLKNMRVKHFSHNDYDGVGCGILTKLAFKNWNVRYLDYKRLDDEVQDFIQNETYKKFDVVLITDIFISEENCKALDELHKNKDIIVIYIDHHATEKRPWILEYEWVLIESKTSETSFSKPVDERMNALTSATSLLFEYFLSQGLKFDANFKAVKKFVESVRRYDTWEWHKVYKDKEPNRWNALLYLYGRIDFEAMVQEKLQTEYIFNQSELTIIKIEEQRIDNYIRGKEQTIIKKNILGHTAGVIFAEQYHSELGNVLAERRPDLDFIIIINPSRTISYRGIREDIHIGNDIAYVFRGGGHPQSAGSPIDRYLVNTFIDMLFGETQKRENYPLSE